MNTGILKILDINGLSYLYTKLHNSIDEFQNESKSVIDTAAAAANAAALRANNVAETADETYATKDELANAINGITSFNFSVVSELPATGTKGVIYLVANTSGNQSTENNGYDEYIWIDTKYEKIGSTSIDLSQYITATTASDTYLSKTDAANTYAMATELQNVKDTYLTQSTASTKYLTKTDAGNTYATGTELQTVKNDYLTKASASTTYLTKTDAGNTYATGTELQTVKNDYLTKTSASSTYVNKTDAGNTYAKKSDLSNVGNFKAVSTVASQGLTDTEKANARANIGAGTSSFSGKYADLSNKPTVQNNLTSDSTTDILSAKQGKELKALVDGKAASSHTHNYAGSSSAGGAATSATKLSTARTISISGAVSGSASFDGSKNITIATTVQSGTSAPTSLATGALYAVYEA